MRAAAQAFLDDVGRRRPRRRRAGDHRPRRHHRAAGADRDRPARRRAVGASSARSTVEDGDGHRRTGPRPGTSPPPPTGATTPRCGSRRATTTGRSSPSRPLVHPELGEGQHLELTRSLPERAPITDAAGAPLFTPTEVVNVGVDTAQVTDLPALAAALCPRPPGIAAEEIIADVQAAPAGQFVPVITLRRPDFEEIRGPGVRPARRGLPDRHPAAGAQRPLRRGAARPGRRGDRRGHRGVARTTARRATPPATSSASPGCSAPSRSSSPARRASPSRW